MKTSAIVLGAGRATRYGQDKMALPYRGSEVLSEAANVFVRHPRIHEVVVVVPARKVAAYRAMLPQCVVVAGGKTRTDSVRRGLEAVHCNRVLVHDGARPNVSVALVDRVLHALYRHPAVVPVVPLCDSLVGETGYCDRAHYRAVQTPQGFDTALLRRCMAMAQGPYTDEGSLVAACSPICYVAGDVTNRKLTHPIDWTGLAGETHYATGYDIHRLVAGRPLVLAGVPIDSPVGLEGHSDADAVLHATMDALLMSAGLPDIGHYFPTDDPHWQDADSRAMLGIVLAELAKHGIYPTHATVSVVAERPHLAPYIAAMRASLATLLHIDPGHVGIAATTNEGVPLCPPFVAPTGDAVAAIATVTVVSVPTMA